MGKIDIENLEMLLSSNNVPTETILKVVHEANKIIQEEKAHRAAESTPAEKFEYCIMVSDPENKIPQNTEVVGWVIKCRAGTNIAAVPEKLQKIAYAYNTAKAGAKNPIKTVGELFQWVKRKFWKPEEMFHTTKDPVRVFFTNNKL